MALRTCRHIIVRGQQSAEAKHFGGTLANPKFVFILSTSRCNRWVIHLNLHPKTFNLVLEKFFLKKIQKSKYVILPKLALSTDWDNYFTIGFSLKINLSFLLEILLCAFKFKIEFFPPPCPSHCPPDTSACPILSSSFLYEIDGFVHSTDRFIGKYSSSGSFLG